MLVFVSVANATNRTDDNEKSIKITTHISKAPLNIRSVNSSDFAVVVRLENKTKKDIVLYPFLSVELFDADGKPIKMSTKIGRYGLRFTDSILEGISFVSIAPGKKHEITINLKKYMKDPSVIAGWRISKPGVYQMKMRYNFDRKLAKSKLGKGCKSIDSPEQPWNKALEIDEKIQVKLKVE
jgi:hypothetical protein